MKEGTGTRKREIEIKLPIQDPGTLRKKLHLKGFRTIVPRHHEFNLVFDTPDQHLRKSGRLLRLRSAADRVILTAKTPPQRKNSESAYKVREETEVHVADFDTMRDILEKIGYEVIFTYEKFREILLFGEAMAMLDETPVGNFMEIEGSPKTIDTLARELGYTRDQYITANYRSLFLATGGHGDMRFPTENE